MATVTAALVKELRERTGAGMMECKKALVEANADIELAIENMRKSGAAKAAKKAGNVAAEGAIIIKEENGVAALLEVNCQTDFVAKDANFTAFAEEVAAAAVASQATVEELQAQFEETRVALVAKIGENINIRRVQYVSGVALASYRHGEKIGVVVAGEGEAETLKHVAMHVAASRPEFLNPEDVPADVVAKEKAVQVEIAMNEGKPAEIAEKMVVGRMKKFTQVLRELEKAMPEDVMVSTDIGNINSVANSYLRFEKPRSFFAAMSFGNCGYAFPTIIGAKAAAPHRPAISYAGDGAWGMSLMETMTCVRHNIPVTAVVFHNRQWGAEKKNQVDFYNRRFVAGELDNQSFAEIARAMGAEGITVDKLEDVGPTLQKAIDMQMNEGKTTIIEIMCTQELGDPFRRDALSTPVRFLDKYKDYV